MTSSLRNNKKLKKFFVDKNTSIKRVRTVINFESSSTSEEVQQLYTENYEQIITLILERFSEAESAPKPVRKGKHYLADILSTLQILHSFVTHCLRNHPQYVEELENILTKSLGYSNKHSMRLASYQILLSALDVLYDKPHESLLPLLFEAINLQPFFSEDSEQPPASFLNGKALSPSNTLPSITDSVELWNCFISKCTENLDKFGFWFNLLKRLYLPVLFPNIIKNLNIRPAVKVPDPKPFKNCPTKLQEKLAGGISKWLRGGPESVIYKIIWPEENGKLIMALCEKFCRLPIEYAATSSRIIEKFREFFFDKLQKSELLREYIGEPTEYYQIFITNILGVFKCASTAETLDIHKSMCSKVLHICQEVTQTPMGRSKENIWVTVQDNLLKTICEFLGNANPFSVKHISTTMAGEMFRCLFEIWLHSPYTTEDMWNTFSKQISRLVSWKALLDQWKDKVIQLTLVFKKLYYDPVIKEFQVPQKKTRRPNEDKDKKDKEEYRIDSSINSIPWTKEKIKKDWYTLVYILGNLNSISLPENFTTAFSCCAAVIELILSAEDQTPLEDPPIIPVCKIYLPWLIEACSVEEKRNRGRLVAYTALCKLFCRLHTCKSVNIDLLVHFYRVIRQGLSSGHSSVIWTIFRHATSIFGLGLPGVNVLIPTFIRELSHLFRPDNKSTVPTDVQNKALQLLSSLICFPNHFPGLEFSETLGSECVSNTIELKAKISNTLLTTLTNSKLNATNRISVIYSISVLMCDDLAHEPRKDTIRDCIKGLITCCTHEDNSVALCAIESLSSLSVYYKPLSKLCLVDVLIRSLCDNIKLLIALKDERINVTVEHYYCILSWVYQIKGNGIEENLLEKIFDAAEMGFVGIGHSIDQFDFLEDLENSSGDENTPFEKASRRSKFFDKIVVSNKPTSSFRLSSRKHAGTTTTINDIIQREIELPSPQIAEAARYFITALLTRYNNFPLPKGTSEGPIIETETCDENALYLIYNLQTILCFEQIKSNDKDNNNNNILQITLRDCTGKYFWDCTLECEDPEYKQINYKKIESSSISQSPSPFIKRKKEKSSNDSIKYSRDFGVIPEYNENTNYEQIDMAEQMLSYISETNNSLIPSGKIIQHRHADKIEKYSVLVSNQVSIEKAHLSQYHETTRTPLPLLPKTPTPVTNLHLCRLFLSHMGLLEEIHKKKIHLLTLSQRLKRSLKELDKTNAREMIKIGLIYVSPGQEKQQEILANDTASKRYTEFSSGLGWSIDVESHGQYKGGLDSRSTGKSTQYYANESAEVIFHDITRMPTNDDPQQIHKKRHVGNDNVHIVWTEHKREYNPATITSQFNDAHIVIYPLENGLNRIQIFKKDKVRIFGPLISSMVLSPILLPTLVRLCAINANNASRLTSDLYKRPLLCRQDLIREINTRYKAEKAFSDFVAELFNNK